MRLLARVDLMMLCQVGAHTEGLAALGARVGLLARVDPPVLTEHRALTEGLAALAAHVGLLARVGPLVLQEVGAAAKGLPALDAPEGPVPAGNGLLPSGRVSRAHDLPLQGDNRAGPETGAALRFTAPGTNAPQRSFPWNQYFL